MAVLTYFIINSAFFPYWLLNTGETSTLCTNSVLGTNNCDANQFSDPFTGPDGNLYVAYSNFNNAEPTSGDVNQYQFLVSKSTDGGMTFSPPVRVAPYNDLPDCATYQMGQDTGRSCVPEKGSSTNSVLRATNYASGQSKKCKAGGGHLRLLHQQVLEPIERLRANRFR